MGPSFWNICRAFEEADYIVGVPLALTNISETVAWASSSASILGLDRIIAFEVGNEPNAYGRVKNTTSGQVFVPPEFYGWLTNQRRVQLAPRGATPSDLDRTVIQISGEMQQPTSPLLSSYRHTSGSFKPLTGPVSPMAISPPWICSSV